MIDYEERLMILKWCTYFRWCVMTSFHASAMQRDSLINIGVVFAESPYMGENVEKMLINANKAIEYIKDNRYLYLKYNSKNDTVEVRGSWDE